MSKKNPYEKERDSLKIPGFSFDKLPKVDKQYSIKVKKFRFPKLKSMMGKIPKVPKV